MKDQKTFYYVYNPQQGKPVYKHEFLEDAKKEARRLANESNDEFFVLAACYSVKKNIFEETEYNELPF